MAHEREVIWIPWADRLVVAATMAALTLNVFPSISGFVSEGMATALGMAAGSSAVVLLAGYVLAILAHYRLIFTGNRTGYRENPEPAERWITWVTSLTAVVIFVAVLWHAFGTS